MSYDYSPPSTNTRIDTICIAGLSLFVAFAIVVCLAAPASAAGVDWHDYIDSVSVNANDLTVVWSLPLNDLTYNLFIDGNMVASTYGTSVTWNMRDYPVQGLFINTQTKIDTTYIPSGSSISVSFDSTYTHSTLTPTAKLTSYLYNSSTTLISSPQIAANVPLQLGSTTTLSGTFTRPDNCSYMRLMLSLSGFGALEEQSEVSQTIAVTSVQIRMTIPQLVEQQYQTGRTNAILEAVQVKLAENGQKLDDILSGNGLDNRDWEHIDDDIHHIGDDILQGIEDSDIDKPDPSDIPDPYDNIDQRASNALASLLAPVWENPILMALLMMSIALMGIRFFLYGKEG